jgi:hypothetical protein
MMAKGAGRREVTSSMYACWSKGGYWDDEGEGRESRVC